MSLINCTECNHSVSSNATSCPNCGNPISAEVRTPAGVPLYTTQATAKKFKKQTLMALAMFFGGFFVNFLLAINGMQDLSMIGGLMALGGLCWYIKTKCQIWWNHA